jgi:opacity protein-like surface antigen
MLNTLRIALVSTVALVSTAMVANAGGTYISGNVGANWDDVESTFLESDTGFVVSGALGTSVKAVPGLRAEVEVAFRTNDVDVFGGFIEAEHNTTSVMGNVAYDFNNVGTFRPYVLAGVGFAHTEGVIENISLATLESSGFAWQLGAGVNTQIAEGVSAGIGYRYFQGPELDVLGFEVSDGSNHSVMATVTLSLD